MGIWGKRKRKLQAPRAPALAPVSLPPLVPPMAPKVIAGQQPRYDFASLYFAVNPGEAGKLRLATGSPSMIRVTQINGLQATEAYTGRLSARPVGTLGGVVSAQYAPSQGALYSRRSTIFLPHGGEWEVSLELLGIVSNVGVDAQLFEDMTPSLYAALSNDKPADVSTATTVVGVPQTRLSSSLNIKRVVLYRQLGLGAGNYYLGHNLVPFPLGTVDTIEPCMESVHVSVGTFSSQIHLE